MLTWKEKESCNVVGEGCLHPPALAESNAKAECFACAYNVCTNCSALVQYRHYGRRRICWNCIIEHSDDMREAEEKIEAYRAAKKAGRKAKAWDILWV